ncbi:MAG: hypothetical protein LBG65_07565 [Puniceicoccales bacterium]|jgi:hypothetical protein|nr:hypothetical protein [Puniceicoccales bacterium]
MQKITVTDSPYASFAEATPGSLDNAQDTLVQLDANGLLIPANGTKPPVGVFVDKLHPGSPHCRVRLFGSGTVRVRQGAPITPGVGVQSGAGAAAIFVIASTAVTPGTPVKLTPELGATGDIIEISA